MKELGVAIVGAGEMAHLHACAWREVPGAEILSVCDTLEDRAAGLAKEYGAAHFSDYREAVAREGVNAVSACVPASLHAEVTVFAAEHGCDVLCEKPIALRVEDADRMAQAAGANHVKLMIGLCHRFFRTQEKAMELVGGGAVGTPRHYHCAAVAGVRPKIAMHDRHGNGGPLVDILCHFVDDMERVLGASVARVYARGHVFAAHHPNLSSIREKAVDTGVVLLDFANGDTGAFSVSWGAPAGVAWTSQQEVWGPEGVLRIRVNDSLELIHSDRKVVYENLKVRQIDREVAHFAACVREGKPVGADAVVARRLLGLSLAALESMETGQPVEIASRS